MSVIQIHDALDKAQIAIQHGDNATALTNLHLALALEQAYRPHHSIKSRRVRAHTAYAIEQLTKMGGGIVPRNV